MKKDRRLAVAAVFLLLGTLAILPSPASAWQDETTCSTCECLYISGGWCCSSCIQTQEGEIGYTGCSGGGCTGADCTIWGNYCEYIRVTP